MASIERVRALWQGWPGAPGYTNLYFNSGGAPPVADVRTFFQAISALLPNGLTIQVPGVGDIIGDDTGQIIGSWSGTAPAVVTGTGGTTAYAGGSGAVAEWKTNGIVAGRRVQGRSFLVPLMPVAMDNAGSLSSTTVNTIQNAGNALAAAVAGDLVVWSRPLEDASGGLIRAGSSHSVASCFVPDLAAQMRSRRT